MGAIGRYTVLHGLARGGMSDVYLATTDDAPATRVALKVLRADLADDPVFRALFFDELRITSRLDHPHAARALDHGEHEGRLFSVFEYVEGPSLEQLCLHAERAGSTVPPGVALRIAADVCSALHAAHELRDDSGAPLHVVHRDVSPSNVVVRRDGVAKLIDFGIAKARDRAAAETRAGFVRGNPRFLSPEQATGKTVDPRTDVWGVGATLFRVLAGVPPFSTADEMDAFAFGLRDLAPFHDSIPQPLAVVLARALARTPAHRFTSAHQLRIALEGVSAELGVRSERPDVAAYLATVPHEADTSGAVGATDTIPEAPPRDHGADEITRAVPRPRQA